MERSTEVEQLVTAWFDAATSGDPSLIARHVSQSDVVRLIGSDPTEVFRGGVDVATFLRGELEASGGRARFTTSDTEAFSDGNVAWATTNLTITLPDGRRVRPRWSSVFHVEDGVWKLVQTHASIGVPNDQVGWVYPDSTRE